MSPPRVPPKFVPTLTEVVRRQPAARSAGAGADIAREERIVQRVMDRLDAELEQRLREAVAALVVEQTRALGPRLREDIEASVREAVAEALAHEQRQP